MSSAVEPRALESWFGAHLEYSLDALFFIQEYTLVVSALECPVGTSQITSSHAGLRQKSVLSTIALLSYYRPLHGRMHASWIKLSRDGASICNGSLIHPTPVEE